MALSSQTRAERKAEADELKAQQDRAWALGQIVARQEEQGRDVAKAKSDNGFLSTALFDEQARIRAAEEQLAKADGGGADFGAGGGAGNAQVRLTANGFPKDPVPFESWLRTGKGKGEAAVYVPDDDGKWGPVMCGGKPVGPDSGTAGVLESNLVAGRDVRIWKFNLADADESGRVLLVVYRKDGGHDVKYALTAAKNPSDDLGGYYKLLKSEVVAHIRKVDDAYALDPLYSGPVVVEDQPDEPFEFRNKDPLSPDPSANPCRVSSGTVYRGGVGLHSSAHTFDEGYSGPVFCRVSSSSVDVSDEPSDDSGTSNLLIFTAAGAMPVEDNRTTFLTYGGEGGGYECPNGVLSDVQSTPHMYVDGVSVAQSGAGNVTVDSMNDALVLTTRVRVDCGTYRMGLAKGGSGACKTVSISGTEGSSHDAADLSVTLTGQNILSVLPINEDNGADVVAGLEFKCDTGQLMMLKGKVKLRKRNGKLETYIDTAGQQWEAVFQTKPLSEVQQ